MVGNGIASKDIDLVNVRDPDQIVALIADVANLKRCVLEYLALKRERKFLSVWRSQVRVESGNVGRATQLKLSLKTDRQRNRWDRNRWQAVTQKVINGYCVRRKQTRIKADYIVVKSKSSRT